MDQDYLTIPENSLFEMLKFQPEAVLLKLFDRLIVQSDTSPFTDEEKIEIENAKAEYHNGETIPWKK